MKIILITLTVIQLIGFASSAFLAKSFILGLEDSAAGLITLAVLWSIYLVYKSYKNKKTKDQVNDNLIKDKVSDTPLADDRGWLKRSKQKVTSKTIMLILSSLLLIAILIIGLIYVVRYSSSKTDYKDEIAKQDLRLKCQEVYNELHSSVESVRYGGRVQSADTVIWSPKTRTCLAYYNVRQKDYHNFRFEVWDYTYSDLVLSYSAHHSDQCVENGVMFSREDFIYKYDKKLEGGGCDLPMIRNGIDLFTNFEKAMLKLGFKK